MFTIHPSTKLKNLFKSKPYQGVNPFYAKFLFIGLDANYEENIESKEIFKQVYEYHLDSVGFWHKHGVHHPFLLPNYHGDGRRYHRNFSKIGFTTVDANKVSFVELLNLPTVGRNKLEPSDLDSSHLDVINDAILNGSPKHIFVSANVLILMKASKRFPWLEEIKQSQGVLPTIFNKNGSFVYKHLHFSNYGKFQLQLEKEALAISNLISNSVIVTSAQR